jgi:hypothetical protein
MPEPGECISSGESFPMSTIRRHSKRCRTKASDASADTPAKKRRRRDVNESDAGFVCIGQT